MIGRLYEWPATAGDPPRHRQVWPGGVWRVLARWASIPGVRVVRNVLVENVETGERSIRPWYPAPRRIIPTQGRGRG